MLYTDNIVSKLIRGGGRCAIYVQGAICKIMVDISNEIRLN